MAMLAEPRRKKRSLNLRGKNHWSEDQNKFGKKLMEKMGWSQGKGLGANEDGKVDHLKVRFKDDSGGVGYKDLNNQWTEHETHFESLLRNLHGGNVNTEKLHSECSLEEKSKKLQSRLHYKKFTRGKDVTKYSHKDLANIFGKKSLNQKPSDKVSDKVQTATEEETVVVPNLNLVEAGCMKEYFKLKMSTIKGAGLSEEKSSTFYEDEESIVAFKGFSCDIDKKDESENGAIKPVSKFNMYSNFQKASDNTLSSDDNTKKKKKRKFEDCEFIEINNDDINEENNTKKCKIMKQIESNELEHDACGDEKAEDKKKSKKNKSKVSDNITVPAESEDVCEEVVTIKKSKKSKKKKVEEDAFEIVEHIDDDMAVKKKEKKNKKQPAPAECRDSKEEENYEEESNRSTNMPSNSETVSNQKVKVTKSRRKKQTYKPLILDDVRKLRSASYSQVVQQCLPDSDISIINSISCTRKLIKKPVDLSNPSDVQSRCKSIKGQLKSTMKIIDDVEMKDVSKEPLREILSSVPGPSHSSPNNISISSFPTIFSSQTASNSWELLSLKKMLDDPFVSATRKQYINQRILELNDVIIKELLLSTQRTTKSEEIVLLENLCLMFDCQNLPAEQKQQLECVLVALREKVINEIMKEICNDRLDYDKVITDLQSLLNLKCLTDEERENIIKKVCDLREKAAKGLLKQTHSPVDDNIQLLEKIKAMMDDPFLPEESKCKILHKIRYFKNKTINKLTEQPISDPDSDSSLIIKLQALLRDPNISYTKRLQIIDKMKKLEASATEILKSYKRQLKDQLTSNMSEILSFVGTNLQTISGYGVNVRPERFVEILQPD